MLKIEDILDDAVRYLKGGMDAQEKEFFEELLDDHPHLKEDLHLIKLTSHGLQELEQQQIQEKASKSTISSKKKFKTRFSIILVILLLIIALLLLYSSRSSDMEPSQKENELVIPYPQVASNERSNSLVNDYGALEVFGGDSKSRNANRGKAICWMPSGEIAFAGTFAGKGRLGDVSFGSEGDRDIIVGRYRPGATYNWVLPFGGKNISDMPKGIVADSKDDLIITGNFGEKIDFGDGQLYAAIGSDDLGKHDFFVAKFDGRGRLQWLDHGGGQRVANQQTGVNTGLAVTTDFNDDIIVAGTYIGTPELGEVILPIGGPNEDTFLAKYTSDGRVRWVKTITSDRMVYAFDVKADQSGNIYIVGSFGHHNLGGSVHLGLDTILTSSGGRDIFLAKYNPEGELLWARQAGSAQQENGFDEGHSLVIDQQGNCSISGLFVGEAFFDTNTSLISLGGQDIFLATYSPEGKLLWVRQAGSTGGEGALNESAQDIAIAKDGSILMTGSFTGISYFGKDILKTGGYSNFFLVNYSPQGDIIWSKQFIPSEEFQAADGMSISVNKSGDFAVTGFLRGDVTIDDVPLSSEGKEVIFLLVFSKEGKLLFSENIMYFA